MQASFRQTAHGKFCCGVIPLTPHCGPDDRKCHMDYRVTVDWQDHPLDRDGFLLDNTWFRQYFADFAQCRVRISCERLAEVIAEQVFSACSGRAVAVRVA